MDIVTMLIGFFIALGIFIGTLVVLRFVVVHQFDKWERGAAEAYKREKQESNIRFRNNWKGR